MDSLITILIFVAIIGVILNNFGGTIAKIIAVVFLIWLAFKAIQLIGYISEKHRQKVAAKQAEEDALRLEKHQKDVHEVQMRINDFNRSFDVDITPFLHMLAQSGSASGNYPLYQHQLVFNKKLEEQAKQFNDYVGKNPGMTPAQYHKH